MMILSEANSQLVYQSALAAPVVSDGSVSRDISGESGKVGVGDENLICPSPWDLKRSFTCRKILRHGTSGFTSHPKKGVLRIWICIDFKNPSP
jgi:hypothetical protein